MAEDIVQESFLSLWHSSDRYTAARGSVRTWVLGFGGFTHTEIAALLQLAPGTVKGRLRLGLTKLLISLGDRAASVI